MDSLSPPPTPWWAKSPKRDESFLSVLPNYAVALEKLTLKKSSNNEVFECVKKSFDEALQDAGFVESNERNNFMNKDNTIKSHKNIETSIDKLKIKFKSFKQEWPKIQSRIKNGSGLAPEKEPHWWKYLVFFRKQTK